MANHTATSSSSSHGAENEGGEHGIDQTANLSENLHKDNNGEYGGLVKVRLAAADAEFEGWVLKTQKHNASEYWVFMAKGSNKLTVFAIKMVRE